MEVAVVLVLAAVAGVAVYRVAMGPPPAGSGSQPDQPASVVKAPILPPSAIVPPAMPNVPMTPVRRTWRTRLTGLAGIVILLPLVGLLLAAALYQAGHILRVMLERFANGG